ncbi:MAG: NUDIX hydrolase [Spirochaetaceae bacterium]|nr:MAG: NUDIX hydrolase [Spirochaetaceae bacterium]
MFMKKIGRVRPYGGAGVLFYRVKGETVEVLLGKRRYRPYAGHWSVPGGRSERNRNTRNTETPLATALRETEEEIGVRFCLNGSGEELPRVRLCVPGIFSFTTFILPYPSRARAYCGQEFTRLEWFPLHSLPTPLHHGVMRAVRELGRMMVTV